ncbi:MAG: hypothetical protein LBI04_07320 [Treponema sp.]|jgi:hypothetical protein|nr:hypothetical protein [Treponema sp.]
MSAKAQQISEFRLRDLLIILICLAGVLYFFYLFRLDLYQTINSRNEKPAGKITIKHNTVQRRLRDRMLWDRLQNESPVYLGDIIRVANLSDATLNINSNNIILSENTIIRIRRAVDGTDSFQIDLTSGNLSLTAGNEAKNIRLNIMGRQVETEPGTVLNASAKGDGMMVQVSEGKALLVDEYQTRELITPAMVAMDSAGVERIEQAVSVKFPMPNAYFLKNRPELLMIDFAWNKYNFRPEQTIRLEIAEDRNFNRIARTIEGLDSTARAVLGAGQWHWRLSLENTILGAGRFTITQAAGPELLYPAMNQRFRFQTTPPPLRFQWSKTESASSYILEVSDTAYFNEPQIKRLTEVEFSIESNLEEGIWYWRVLPVFPDVYEGSASFSSVNSFRIERSNLPERSGRSNSVIMDASADAAADIAEESLVDAAVLANIVPATASEPSLPATASESSLPATASESSLPTTPRPVVRTLRLISPEQRASIPGLTALRQQTVFHWDSDEAVQKSRFVLSRDPDPVRRPAVEIPNPGRTVRVDRLEEGVWYWTVEAQNANGNNITAQPQHLTVLPIPLLAAPENRLPQNRYRFDIEELKKTSAIVFRWQAVPNANAYIFTLYQETSNGRRQIFSRAPENSLNWTLDDFSMLDGQGTFIWQVEAVNMRRDGRIEQRGRPGENSFIMDIPRAGPVQIKEPGVLYGN